MKVYIEYNGVPSLVSASFLIKNKIEVEMIGPKELHRSISNDLVITPYTLPILATERKDYNGDMFCHIGLDPVKDMLLPEKEMINVVFGNIKIDFTSATLIEDVARLFPSQVKNVINFLSDIKSIDEQRLFLHRYINKNIGYLYDKHKLSKEMRLIFDVVLLVASGSYDENIPLKDAARVIMNSLSGVLALNAKAYSMPDLMMKALQEQLTMNDSFPDNNVKQTILNVDAIKSDFVLNFDNVKSKYGAKIRYPMSMFFRTGSKDIPSPLSKCLIYVDTDESNFYTLNDVYVLDHSIKGSDAILRMTCFMPQGAFDVNCDGHREKLFIMKNIVEDLIPAMSVKGYSCYPDPQDVKLHEALSVIFGNMVENDIIYGNIYENVSTFGRSKGCLVTGREPLYWLGFEAGVITGLTAAKRIIRNLKR